MLANELVQDGGSSFLNPVAKSLMRSVALGFDREALIGTGSGKGFIGISKTAGIQTHAVTGGLKDLDPFVTAFGKLEAANAKATAIVMSPKTWSGLMALREATGSLKPLLSESAGSPTTGIQRSILGVPVWLSPFLPDAEILTYEADQVFAVWRKDAGFEISDQFGFLKDGTGGSRHCPRHHRRSQCCCRLQDYRFRLRGVQFMSFFNADEPTVLIQMTGHMSYGPLNTVGVPARLLLNGETYDVPQSEADWLVGADLAERV